MLPLPTRKDRLDPLVFTTGAGLIHRLGAESVSDPVISVVELVKNSYDDDAENVIITLKNIKTGAGRSEKLFSENDSRMAGYDEPRVVFDGCLRGHASHIRFRTRRIMAPA